MSQNVSSTGSSPKPRPSSLLSFGGWDHYSFDKNSSTSLDNGKPFVPCPRFGTKRARQRIGLALQAAVAAINIHKKPICILLVELGAILLLSKLSLPARLLHVTAGAYRLHALHIERRTLHDRQHRPASPGAPRDARKNLPSVP